MSNGICPTQPLVAPTRGAFGDGNDKAVIKQEGNDLFKVTINGQTTPYTKQQLEVLSAAGYFEGLGGNDSFEIDVWDNDLELTLVGGEDPDSFSFTGAGGRSVVFHQGQGQGQGGQGGQGQGQGAPASNCTPPAASTSATPPAGTATSSGPVSGNGNSITGNNNTIINHAAATSTANGIAKDAKFDIAAAVARGNSGLTESSPGVYTGTLGGFNVTVTQPGGAGTPMNFKMTVPSGTLKGATIDITLNADSSYTVKTSGGNLTADQHKSLNQIANEGIEMLMEMTTGKSKKKGSGSGSSPATSSTGGGSDASGIDAGGMLDSTSGAGGASGLDTSGGDMSDSWFLVLAKGMGTIMNNLAEKMVDLLNKIKAAGDDPPFKLTAEFQAKSQQLAYMQQAFATAMNALGEAIKTGVQAGGAAR